MTRKLGRLPEAPPVALEACDADMFAGDEHVMEWKAWRRMSFLLYGTLGWEEEGRLDGSKKVESTSTLLAYC